jgi:hypothetical protein
MRSRLSKAATIFCAVLILTACGSSSSSSDSQGGYEQAAIQYLEALNDANSSVACNLLAADAKAKMSTIEKGSGSQQERCEKLFSKGAAYHFPEAKGSKVKGNEAEVEVEMSGGEKINVFLIEEEGRWRVSGVAEPDEKPN